jgi:histidinol-phosphate phosphatase family protein
MSRRAVFLDRDGTLMVDVGYPRDPAQVRLLPGVSEGLAACRAAGYLLAIISNQSGVGRGYFGPEAVDAVHRQLLDLLATSGITIDDAQYCLHAPEDRCDCRKPSPRMIQRSARRLGADLKQSFMVGDKPSDVEAGRLAGCRTILLRDDATRTDSGAADFVARDWHEIADRILESSECRRESGA